MHTIKKSSHHKTNNTKFTSKMEQLSHICHNIYQTRIAVDCVYIDKESLKKALFLVVQN